MDQNVGVYISLNSGGGPSLGAQRCCAGSSWRAFVDRYYPAAPHGEPVALPTAREHGARSLATTRARAAPRPARCSRSTSLGQTTVQMLPNGDLVGPGLPDVNGEPKHWREVEPWVWQAVGGEERMGARVDENGRVTAIAFEPLVVRHPEHARAVVARRSRCCCRCSCVASACFAADAVQLAAARHRCAACISKPFPYEGARAQAHRIAAAASLAGACSMSAPGSAS